MRGDVSKKQIEWAEVHDLFVEISDEFGYQAEEYTQDVLRLVSLWEEQGHIEIYLANDDRAFGRAKDSSNAPGAVPWYLGLFHVRLKNWENDPLIVITFDERNGSTYANLRFMTDHDQMFGHLSEKNIPSQMRMIRQRVDEFIQRGNKLPE